MGKKKRMGTFAGIWGVVLVLIAGDIFAGWRIWSWYKDRMMGNQKEQLLLLTNTLAANIEQDIQGFVQEVEFLSYEVEHTDRSKELLQDYPLYHSSSRKKLLLWHSQGEEGIPEMPLSPEEKAADIQEDLAMYQSRDSQGNYWLVFRKELAEGALCLAVDMEGLYSGIIENIHIGRNGYVVVKNSQGRILMHPDRQQWGIDVIEGRRVRFPQADLESLEALIARQRKGGTGVSEYYSYWWTSPSLERVKKIAAYAPARMGEDFLIISAVTDYSDFYAPIREGFGNFMVFTGGTALIFVLFVLFIFQLWQERGETKKQIKELRILNASLEKYQKNSQKTAHQQRLQIMGIMTAGIAHEFNNFLVPIMGYSEMLMESFEKDSEAYDFSKEIFEASAKAKEVVRQISSLGRKNPDISFGELQVKDFLQKTQKMMATLCPEHILFTAEIEDVEERIFGSKTQLNQVFLNIFANAVYAIGENKEGRIWMLASGIEGEKVRELLKDQMSEDWEKYLLVEIRDNGRGMAKEMLKQIFDPFYTTKPLGEGTGLGLAIVSQILNAHKGGIRAQSRPGEGSSFQVFLPLLDKREKSSSSAIS